MGSGWKFAFESFRDIGKYWKHSSSHHFSLEWLNYKPPLTERNHVVCTLHKKVLEGSFKVKNTDLVTNTKNQLQLRPGFS